MTQRCKEPNHGMQRTRNKPRAADAWALGPTAKRCEPEASEEAPQCVTRGITGMAVPEALEAKATWEVVTAEGLERS